MKASETNIHYLSYQIIQFLITWRLSLDLFMDKLEDHYTDQTNIYVFTTIEAEGKDWDPVKLA